MSRELDEIWALYADDGGQSLDLVEQSLANLKETPANAAYIAALFRAIHTFKGNARVLGLASIERCAHAAEDLVGLVRDENVPLTPDLQALLLEVSDVLREMMNESLAQRADPALEGSQALVDRICAKVEECRAAQRGEPAAPSEPEAIIFEPVKESALGNDLGYLQIFAEIASGALDEARAVLEKLQAGEAPDLGILAPTLEHVRFAAGQMGLLGWPELLEGFLARSEPSMSDLEALIAGMKDLMPEDALPQAAQDLPQPEAPEQTAPGGPASREENLAGAPESGPAAAKEAFQDLKDSGVEILTAAPGQSQGGSLLASDPTYRAIFLDMVHDILREMEAALAEFGPEAKLALTSQVDRLVHAAKQIGMAGWLELLSGYPRDRDLSFSEAETFVTKLQAQAILDTHEKSLTSAAGEEGDGSLVCQFFESLPPLLASVSSFGSLLLTGNVVDSTGFLTSVAEIGSKAAALEFVRIVDITKEMADERQFTPFRRLELRLYEELVSVEQAMRPHLPKMDFEPAAVLQNWCADQAYDTLIELDHTLEEMRKHGAKPGQSKGIAELLRLIYYACRHYTLETASHLSMSLIDLFARARDEGTLPDPMLVRITKSFVTDLELLFDTVGSGGIPDMAEIEKLFEEAANVTFSASGTPSSTVMETRLGLPKSFRKVLTPESLQAAMAALDGGQRFYIVRAALNHDEQAADRFLEWVNSGAATVITNVTVFDKKSTQFDFLLATPMAENQLTEKLTTLDPARSSLKIEMALSGGKGGQEQAAPQGAPMRATASQDLMPRDILEGIGEIVTGQAMIYRTLGDIAAEDLMRTVEAEVQKANGDWGKAKGAVRSALEGLTGQIEKIYQAEAQLGHQLERLQEEAIAVRARPATLLTKPLEAFAETTARQYGRPLQFEVSGDDIVVDHDMLEELRPHLRTLIEFCLSQSTPASSDKSKRGKLRLALARNEERIVATLDDSELAATAIQNGSAEALLSGTRAALRSRGGELRTAPLPEKGVHFEVILPMAMVVLDGMVVRVGEFRYVVPLDTIQRIVHSGIEDIMRLSAEGGRFMLRLGREEVLPVHCLRDVASDGSIKTEDASSGKRHLFVVVGKQSQRVALLVDELMGQQLVLIRPLRGYLTGIHGVTGCALLGGGDVGMVLDIANIVSAAA